MALTKAEKEAIIADYVEKFSRCQAMIITGYSGLKVSDLRKLRGQLRESGNHYQVVKNSLAGIALERLGLPVPEQLLRGPVGIGLCYTDIASVAKVLNSAVVETKILEVRGAILGQSIANAEQAKALSEMPSREVLLGKLLGTLQAPISGLVNVLAGPMRGLVTVLKAHTDQLASAS